MSLYKEFKEFAIKGNVVDLAIAVVIGAAFSKVVTALTDSIIMPLVSLVMGKGGVSDLVVIIGPTKFPVGIFLQALIDFILVALVLFVIIKAMNSLNRKKEQVPTVPELSMTEKLLVEIRDELSGNKTLK